MKLSDIQNQFLDSIYSEDKSLNFIKPTHSNQEETITIYKDAVNAQLINTLKIVFPICESMLGSEFFSAMAYEYLRQYPSESSNLNVYGKYMPSFMKNFKPLEDYPYFSDIAQMEYHYDEINRFTFEEIENKDLSDFEESQYGNLKFKVINSLKLFSSSYKVAQIWRMHEENEIREINISGEITYNIVYKSHYKTDIREIGYSEYLFLNACKEELSLDEILEKYPEIVDDLGKIIVSVLQNSLIQQIEVQ